MHGQQYHKRGSWEHEHGEMEHVCVHGGGEVETTAASECEEILDEARAGTGLSRRSMLTGLGLATAGAGVLPTASSAGAPGPGASGNGQQPPVGGPHRGLELVLLGTRAGPPVVPHHKGTAFALVVDGATYVIDAGRGAVTQFSEYGLRFETVKAMFLTHLHADHVADYYNFFLLAGHIPTPDGDQLPGSVPIYGPGSAGDLPPKFGGGTAPTVNPDNPVPGTQAMTDALHAAYAYSSNVFLRDMDIRDIRELMQVNEIELPTSAQATYENTAPTMDPLLIYQDDVVEVRATLVPHGPMFPAFGYRFDTPYGSVTFSGDTKRSENLIAMGQGTDLLVHEAIGVEGAPITPAALDHMLMSHVVIGELGPVAQDMGAKHLVVAHYTDLAQHPLDVNAWRRQAQIGYSGQVTIGQDLQSFALGPAAVPR